MIRKIFIPFAAILFFSACGENPSKNEKTTLSIEEQSKKLYIDNCVVCHGDDGKRQLANASDLSITKLNNNQLKEVIKNGRKSMPPYKSVFSDEELDLLTNYIVTNIKE